MSSLLDLFTGSNKWLYIALAVCGVGFVGMTGLSVQLYADKTALQTTVTEQNKLIDTQAKEVKKLDSELAQAKADLQTQNALNDQYSIDLQKAKKTYDEAMAKKPPFRTQYVGIDRTNDEAKDLHAFVKKWRVKP